MLTSQINVMDVYKVQLVLISEEAVAEQRYERYTL
jgi:hypothetical protein